MCSILLLGQQAQAQSIGHGNANISKQAALAAQLKQAEAAMEALQKTMIDIQSKVEDPQTGLQVTAEKVAGTVARKPQLALIRTSCTTDDKTGFCELSCNKSEYRSQAATTKAFGFLKDRKLRDHLNVKRPKRQTPKEYFEENYDNVGDLRMFAEKVSSVDTDLKYKAVYQHRSVEESDAKVVVQDDFETAGCYARKIEVCKQYGASRGEITCRYKKTVYLKTKCTAVCAGAGYLKDKEE